MRISSSRTFPEHRNSRHEERIASVSRYRSRGAINGRVARDVTEQDVAGSLFGDGESIFRTLKSAGREIAKAFEELGKRVALSGNEIGSSRPTSGSKRW